MRTAIVKVEDEVVRVAIVERGEKISQVVEAAGFTREPGSARLCINRRVDEWEDEEDFAAGPFGNIYPAMVAAGLTRDRVLDTAVALIEQIIAIEGAG